MKSERPRRPRRRDPGKLALGPRQPLSFRIGPETRARLEEASARSGRSIAQEAELLVESALLDEHHQRDSLEGRFGRQGAAIFELLQIFMAGRGDWLEDPAFFADVRGHLDAILDAVAPRPAAPHPADPNVNRSGRVRAVFGELFAPAPTAAWFRLSLLLRERLGPAAVARIIARINEESPH